MLALAGVAGSQNAGVIALGDLDPRALRNFYGAADVLVMPSVRTRSFREPWGLVANEAMLQRTPVIATDAVGAAAGGLVRDGRTGLVTPAGDADALARALVRLAGDPALREQLGSAGMADAGSYTFAACAEGVSAALASIGRSRESRA